jgi:hypothetical protein
MTDQNWFAAAPWFWPMYNLLVSERFQFEYKGVRWKKQ